VNESAASWAVGQFLESTRYPGEAKLARIVERGMGQQLGLSLPMVIAGAADVRMQQRQLIGSRGGRAGCRTGRVDGQGQRAPIYSSRAQAASTRSRP
jgi:hypothetical protein